MARRVRTILHYSPLDLYSQTRFETTPVMSAYLLAFAIGDFDVLSAPTKQNVVVRVYFPPCTIPPLF